MSVDHLVCGSVLVVNNVTRTGDFEASSPLGLILLKALSPQQSVGVDNNI